MLERRHFNTGAAPNTAVRLRILKECEPLIDRVAAGQPPQLRRAGRLLRGQLEIANDRLQELPDGRLALRFKQAWRDGTTHIVFTAQELIEKLIPLIPRPRCHLVRYHGILGPAAKDRAKVVPTAPAPPTPDAASADSVGTDKAGAGESREIDISKVARVSRLPWAVLLKRVFLDSWAWFGCVGESS